MTHFAVLVKPEVASAPGAVPAAVRVLESQGVTVRRTAVLPAVDFASRGLLLLHYPRLHRVAADGEAALTTGARAGLAALRDRTGLATAVGAYEAMTQEPELSVSDLEARTRAGGITKLGSGSYASPAKVGGREVIVLNGFLPSLTEGYRTPGAQAGMLECHSDREIGALRDEVLGELHPLRAAPGTLRGTLGAWARDHGIEVHEGRNAVHLSAGHLEGMFQAWRYFGGDLDGTPLGAALASAGVGLPFLASLAADPNLPDGTGGTVAPHGATENLSRDEVVALVCRWAAVHGKDDFA